MNCRYLRSPALLRTARRLFATRKNCRSEEHTSELQSQSNLVCRLLLEKKKRPPSCPCLCPWHRRPSPPAPLRPHPAVSRSSCKPPPRTARGRVSGDWL